MCTSPFVSFLLHTNSHERDPLQWIRSIEGDCMCCERASAPWIRGPCKHSNSQQYVGNNEMLWMACNNNNKVPYYYVILITILGSTVLGIVFFSPLLRCSSKKFRTRIPIVSVVVLVCVWFVAGAFLSGAFQSPVVRSLPQLLPTSLMACCSCYTFLPIFMFFSLFAARILIISIFIPRIHRHKHIHFTYYVHGTVYL